jgi:hypothetical protein
MVAYDLRAPAQSMLLLASGMKFYFVLTTRQPTNAEIEIRVVTRDTGRLLSKPNHRTPLRGVSGTAFVDVPIWRGCAIEPGQSLPLSIQVKPVGLTTAIELSIALVMVETEEQLLYVTRLEEGYEEW